MNSLFRINGRTRNVFYICDEGNISWDGCSRDHSLLQSGIALPDPDLHLYIVFCYFIKQLSEPLKGQIITKKANFPQREAIYMLFASFSPVESCCCRVLNFPYRKQLPYSGFKPNRCCLVSNVFFYLPLILNFKKKCFVRRKVMYVGVIRFAQSLISTDNEEETHSLSRNAVIRSAFRKLK